MMEFRDVSPANLVFASVLDHSRNLKEITSEWDLDHNEFSTEDLKAEIDRLVDNKIMKDGEHGLKAHLASQSFRTELESHIEYMHNEDASEVVLNDLSPHYSLLRSTGFRTGVLNLENIKAYYDDEPENAKENPLNLIYNILKVLEGVKAPENMVEREASNYR